MTNSFLDVIRKYWLIVVLFIGITLLASLKNSIFMMLSVIGFYVLALAYGYRPQLDRMNASRFRQLLGYFVNVVLLLIWFTGYFIIGTMFTLSYLRAPVGTEVLMMMAWVSTWSLIMSVVVVLVSRNTYYK